LCEKPLAMNADEAADMVAVCEAEGVRLMEAFMYRLHPSLVATRELVTSGRIGRLMSVDSWFSYFNDDPTNIRNIAEVGGGGLFDIGCYTINVSRFLFGAEPRTVDARLERDPATGVDILASAILGFAGGTATFTCSTRTEPDQRVDVYGTEGRIRVHIPFNIPPDRPTEITVTAGGEPPVAPASQIIRFEPADPYAVEAELFAAAILDGLPTPTPPADAIANMRVIDRVFAAADAGGAS
jgi:predicted dehydrogenase